jgi:hypothetical protein
MKETHFQIESAKVIRAVARAVANQKPSEVDPCTSTIGSSGFPDFACIAPFQFLDSLSM